MIFVSSSCVKATNIAEIIHMLARQGIKNIELSGGTDYYTEIGNDLKKLRQVYDLKYACHAYFPPPQIPFVVNLASCSDQIYKQSIMHYVQCIEMLKHINCKVLSIHAGFLIEIGLNEVGQKLNNRITYDEDSAYDRFCTAYEYISKLCYQNNIDLYLENNVLNAENYKEFDYHNYMMMTDYDSIIMMRKQLDFNLLLDLGHLYVSSKTLGISFMQECSLLKEYVRWIHISENNGVFDEHQPLKENSEIFTELSKLYNTEVNITLETKGKIEDILSSIELIESI